MNNRRIRYWGDGKQSKLIFEIKLWKLRLELWHDIPPNNKSTQSRRSK